MTGDAFGGSLTNPVYGPFAMSDDPLRCVKELGSSHWLVSNRAA